MSRRGDSGHRRSPWMAHEYAERVPDEWCWFCTCIACRLAMTALARLNPRLLIYIKTSADRIYVTAQRAAAVWNDRGSLDPLLHASDDWIREVMVGVRTMPVGRDYLSVTQEEHALDRE